MIMGKIKNKVSTFVLLRYRHKWVFSYSYPVTIFVVINEGVCNDKGGSAQQGRSYLKFAVLYSNPLWTKSGLLLAKAQRQNVLSAACPFFLEQGFADFHY